MTQTIIKDAIDNVLSIEQLKTLHAGLSTHQEEYRLKALAKQIFMRDLNASCDARKAMELNIRAIESAITLGFYSNYYMDNGILDWAMYTTNIMKATDARGGKHAKRRRRQRLFLRHRLCITKGVDNAPKRGVDTE